MMLTKINFDAADKSRLCYNLLFLLILRHFRLDSWWRLLYHNTMPVMEL